MTVFGAWASLGRHLPAPRLWLIRGSAGTCEVHRRDLVCLADDTPGWPGVDDSTVKRWAVQYPSY